MKKHLLLMTIGALMAAPGHAATLLIGGALLNGNFESSSTGTVMFISGNIANWANWAELDTANNNTGVYTNQGDRTAFIQSGGAIRNMTTYVATVGDIFTYSFDNELAGRSSATMQLVYDDGGVITAIPGSQISGSPVNTISGSFTVQAGDAWVGKTIGVGISTPGNFPELDNVTLSVVPEPAAAMLGMLGVTCLLRRRRA